MGTETAGILFEWNNIPGVSVPKQCAFTRCFTPEAIWVGVNFTQMQLAKKSLLDEEELMFDSPDYNISDSRNNKTSSKK